MKCPICKEPMVVLELDKIEIDHCISCGGIWLDRGELELLIENDEEQDTLLDSFQVNKKAREKRRRCPICNKKMEKISCGKEEIVLIDKCHKNDGLWFDLGELDKVLGMGCLDKKDKICSMLKAMFNLKSERP